ncbi:hypothetical protein ANCDUO_14696 [Ancylostoma duodenale]|uniref:Uncharacterized protein n=1 Tax=Ancylostoma duodenale TaxID=51022 RepID=A0A0C2G2I5_9BILA|nr:hypothetical protein ANCDUO_14696 [Ancylostoma duodenale]
MANGKNTKIGCSYNKIRSATVFLCAYDDKSSVARGLEPDAAGGNAPKAEQMLKMATAKWWSELRENGVGESNILTPDLFNREYYSEDGVLKPISHYLAMAKDISYKLGCVIHTCNDGKYVHCLSGPRGPQPVNKPIYQVGEPCKKNSDCKGKFVCSVDEGLCSLF